MSVFHLKARDTRPILEVALINPDGTVHNLTGTTSWKLHIHLSAGVVFTRDMLVEGPEVNGILRYVWVATDWEPVNPADPKLPNPGSPFKTIECPMEYEVSAATQRMTFPNHGAHDKIQIKGDLA